MRTYALLLLSIFLFTNSCTNSEQQSQMDYRIGAFGAFSEAVAAGAKEVALSEPMSTEEMDEFLVEAEKIANYYEVSIFRESDFMPSDLFPEDVAANKEVLLIYQGQGLAKYQALKADREALVKAGAYQGVNRTQIARRFGRLLGYSPRGINELLSAQTDFRTMYDFGVEASNTFLYYKDLAAATQFYQNILGLELLADYGMATTFRISAESYLILVDAAEGMHTADEPKTVALALLTDQLEAWWNYLNEQNVSVKYSYKTKEGGPHDGFVMIDPEGYLLEFELFKQHPENEGFMPYLDQAEHFTTPAASSKVPEGLGFKASITWLYYQDMLEMQQFYEEVLGLELVADQGWTKIYGVSNTGFIGLVDERRGMHDFTKDKAVTVSFLLKDLRTWYDYVKENQVFELRTGEWETGPESRYNAFVGYDPQGYFMEFDQFLEHPDNKKLLEALK